MIRVIMTGHQYEYPLCDVLRMFYGTASVSTESTNILEASCEEDLTIRSILNENGSVETISDEDATLYFTSKSNDFQLPPNREVKRQLYAALSRWTGRSFPWGSLTGIRPTGVARELETPEEMSRRYFTRNDKARLAFETAANEDAVLLSTKENHVNVYIGIPFCPSRCSYCSFISQDATKHLKILPEYIDALLHEMELVLHSKDIIVDTVYMGGGTPTVFSESEFRRLCDGVFSFPAISGANEITVEAGRPDTITESKLLALREHGISRICINPQTLCNDTLERVGRRHTEKDFYAKYDLARKMGFHSINTDLIAGLPGETQNDFETTLRKIISLQPENITIHSLYKKRSARLTQDSYFALHAGETDTLDAMLGFAADLLASNQYRPYYLYRQKDTMGGHENVGYERNGTPCVYNVAMMSDQRSVLSFGAGGMSKRAFPAHRVERCSCIKDPLEYVRKVEEMAMKKIAFFEYN